MSHDHQADIRIKVRNRLGNTKDANFVFFYQDLRDADEFDYWILIL